MNYQLSSNRLHWMDATRCLACFAVVLVHVTYLGGNGGDRAIAIYGYYAVASASIVYFMLTGALTLWRPKPIGAFLRERLVRVFVPMLIWTAITLAIDCATGRMAWSDLPAALAQMPVKPQVPFFWFIYMAMGIYVFVPILATWLQQASRRQVELLLAGWGAALCVPALTLVWPAFGNLLSEEFGILFYAQGYMGLMLLGYYLRRWGKIEHWRWGHIVGAAALLCVPLVLFLTHWHTATFLHRLSPNIVALGALVVIAAQSIRFARWSHRALYVGSQLTFGIYLTHRIVTQSVIIPLFESWCPNYWWGIPLATLLCVGICGLIAYALSLTPVAVWLGCRVRPYSSEQKRALQDGTDGKNAQSDAIS